MMNNNSRFEITDKLRYVDVFIQHYYSVDTLSSSQFIALFREEVANIPPVRLGLFPRK